MRQLLEPLGDGVDFAVSETFSDPQTNNVSHTRVNTRFKLSFHICLRLNVSLTYFLFTKVGDAFMILITRWLFPILHITFYMYTYTYKMPFITYIS